ncbi:glycosyltransferase family 2 protein [Pelomonas sp. Root405]|uniref:glycosyltransferase family 2 protein n=1 Tax=Pelomonas sp. Root405 TaxID=1736529 RepID=UPI001F427D9A|nr:glycosyltransferase family 2 protein [Pelomonas sp. Root405]
MVVLLNWNGWRDTLECLDSLFAEGATPCRVLVCDNASRDESVPRIRTWAEQRFGTRFANLTRADVDGGARLEDSQQFALIENGGNLGFAAGNNVGIKLALRDPRCRYVWVLNNDTVVLPDALGQAVERMQADPSVGLCGSTLVYFDEPDKVQALGGASYSRWSGRSRHVGAFMPRSEVPQDSAACEARFSYVVGAAMLVSRAFLEQVGLMREDYFLYYEEIDWATRGGGRFRLGYAPGSVVLHKEGASIGTAASGGSPLSLYFLYRNRLRFSWRFHRPFVASVVYFSLLDVARLAVRRRWPQVGAALRGILQLSRPPAPAPARP